MSRDYRVQYNPPTGTKYKWFPPSLTHLGWACNVKCLAHPQSLHLAVDRDARGYFGYLRFNSIQGGTTVTKKTRHYKKALTALLATERAGDELLKADSRPWMKRALAMGWRPPA